MSNRLREVEKYGATCVPVRVESDVRDCVVKGAIPRDLNGGFYATGPDPQYPLAPGNIPFDGDGHVRLFRFRDGRVDYRSRYVHTERYVAQDKARRSLMPMYRNPGLDDPSVAGLSRSTANTHVIHHRNFILALKEDSPPSALDLHTLATIDPVYTFDGQLPRTMPFTAHPKVCSTTGNIVAFGYEAHGDGSDAVVVFEIDPAGRKTWSAEIQVPYISGIHDFAVTENYVAFFLTPLSLDRQQLERGGIRWSWDPEKPCYFGYLRRHGDGKDIRWIKGPARGGSHILGAFEKDGRLFVDREASEGNSYPFIPDRSGAAFDRTTATSYLYRISVDLAGQPDSYSMEKLSPLIAGLPRQDDRYNTLPYRYAFSGCPDPSDPIRWKFACYARLDLETRTHEIWKAPANLSLGEPVFAPRSADAPEGDGYLLGVAWDLAEDLRSDLLIFDAGRIPDGPIATVRLPMQASPQIHGWWVREDQYPR